MKKYSILLLFFVLMIDGLAQTPGIMKRKAIPGKVDTLLAEYLLYSKFSSLEDVGFSDEIANRFKSLFTADAKLTDEVNPMIYDKNYEHPFDLPVRTVDEYIAKTKENYPYGVFLKFKAITVDYSKLTVLLLKETNGTTKTGLNYRITDTIRLKLEPSANNRSMKIAEIIVMGYATYLSNDVDRDFIPDALDKCPEIPGFRTPDGCLTKEEKVEYAKRKKEEKDELARKKKEEKDELAKRKKEDKGDVVVNEKKDKEEPVKKEKKIKGPSLPGFYIGFTLSGGNNNFTTPFATSNLGYESLIKGDKSVQSITNLRQTKQAPFTQIQLDIDYYFGAKKKFGIATGVGLTNFNAGFTMDSFHVEFKDNDASGNVYRRLVKASAIEEDYKIKTINVPFVLQYRFNLGDKTNLTIGLGANYQSMSSAKANGSAAADYEAIYNYGNTNGSATFFDSSATPARGSWLITRNNVESHGGSSQRAAYFTQKRADGYEVALDQTLTKSEDIKFVSGVGTIIRIGANFKLNEKLWLATLFQFQNLTFTNNSYLKNYTLTDEIGDYNLLLNNVSTFTVTTVSLGIGIKYTLK